MSYLPKGENCMDELRMALELATDEELQDLTEILFKRKFNPLDYLHAPDLIEVQSQGRQAWLDALEQRFRFLAADGFTVLKGETEQLSYRRVLLQTARYLKLSLSPSLSTTDLEAEIFLSLLKRVWHKMPSAEKKSLKIRTQKAIAECSDLPLPAELRRDPLRLLLEGSTALAVTALVRPMLLQLVARQFAAHFAAYHVAREAIVAVPLQIQNYMAMQAAKEGMSFSAARYGVTRSAFAFLGSALWVWFFADLGWRTIATNYGRVIPTVFALAQIRLTRAECFNPT
jgi:uncharacterized protein YaaW (UPF0174 family)